MSKQKQELSHLGDLGDVPSTVDLPRRSEGAPKTAVGRMFHDVVVMREEGAELERLRAEASGAALELSRLRSKVADAEGSTPTRQLDPNRIRASAFRNRIDANYEGHAWEAFKQSIKAAGGNSVPIRVRRLENDPEHDYEIVWGHRRHRACIALTLPVLAEIVEATDLELYDAMTRENLERNNLSPYEWGVHYANGTRGFTLSTADLAARFNTSKAHVSYALQLAALPAEVLRAFSSPLDLQLKWGAELARRLAKDRDAVVSAAEEISAMQPRPSPSHIYARLVGAEKPKVAEIKRNGKLAASIVGKDNVVTVRFAKGAIPLSRISQLKKLVSDFLGSSADE